MEKRLTIGIVRLVPGWKIILEQLGVPYEVINRWDAVTPDRYSAIVVDAPPDSSAIEALGAYVNAGGALLDGGFYLPAVEPEKIRRRRLRSIIPAPDDDLFRDIWLADLHAPALLHRDARHMGKTIYLGERGHGFIAYLPFDLERLMRDIRPARKQFYTRSRPFPNEIAAQVSKGELRRMAQSALQWLHARRGLPYVHRWQYPGRLPGVFCYRIDSDYGTEEQVDTLHRVARDHDIRMTWFLHTEAHAGWLANFRAMPEQEMGLHGFRHRTFGGYEENRSNIAEAAAMLEREGIPFTGFAAPNGFWNVNLARAIEDAGLLYSSEFSLDYDNLPFFPVLHGYFSPVVQVPVHPVCIGSLMRVKSGADAMKEYFRDVIDRKLHAHEPVMLYHHPGHEHWDVAADSFRHANDRGLKNITMGEYAGWWRRRSSVKFEALYNGSSIALRFRHREPDVEIAVRDSNGRYGFIGDQEMRDEGRWDSGAIEWSGPSNPGPPPPEDIGKIRRWSPILLRHSIEDYNSRARQ